MPQLKIREFKERKNHQFEIMDRHANYGITQVKRINDGKIFTLFEMDKKEFKETKITTWILGFFEDMVNVQQNIEKRYKDEVIGISTEKIQINDLP